MSCVFLEKVVGLEEDPFLFGGETHFCYAKADFAPVKVNIGLGKVYFFLGKGHFWSRKRGFASGKVNFGLAGKPIWVGGKRDFVSAILIPRVVISLGKRSFCLSENKCGFRGAQFWSGNR